MMNNTKKYWLKLEEGFLDSGHIKVLKRKENGKDLIFFYLAIMLKSIKSDGHLRFSDSVPYDEEMLAAITDTDFEIVRQATANLKSLGLLEILENGTIFLTDMPRRIGKESDSAERVRNYRAKEKTLQCNGDATEYNDAVTKCNDNKEEEKREDLEEDKKQNKKKNSAGSAAALLEIISSYTSNDELKVALNSFIEMRKLIKKPMTANALALLLTELDKNSTDIDSKIQLINRSVLHSWAGIWPPEPKKQLPQNTKQVKQSINYDEE